MQVPSNQEKLLTKTPRRSKHKVLIGNILFFVLLYKLYRKGSPFTAISSMPGCFVGAA